MHARSTPIVRRFAILTLLALGLLVGLTATAIDLTAAGGKGPEVATIGTADSGGLTAIEQAKLEALGSRTATSAVGRSAWPIWSPPGLGRSNRVDPAVDPGLDRQLCPPPIELVSSVAVPSPEPREWYYFVQPTAHWSATGVRQPDADWDIAAYLIGSGGSFPVCFRSSLALSQLVGVVDLVVADFNHTAVDTYYVRTYEYSGQGDAVVEWDNGPDVLSLGAPPVAAVTGADDVLEIWDVFLEDGGRYVFELSTTGDAATRMCLFENPASETYWAGRTWAEFDESTTTAYLASRTDWYGLLVVNDNGLAGTYTIAADTCAAPEAQPLTAGVGVITAAPGGHYVATQNESYWCAIGVRGDGPEWDLSVHDADCYRDLLAESASTAATEIVVGDFNHNPVGEFYARAVDTGSGVEALTQWDDDPDEIVVDAAPISVTVDASDVVRIWDVALEAGTDYEIHFQTMVGSGLRLLVFRSPDGPYWAGRSEAVLETSGTAVYTAPETDRYALVLVNDGGAGEIAEIGVSAGAVEIADGLPTTPPSTRVVATWPSPGPGPIRIRFELAQGGVVSFNVLDVAGRLVSRIPERSFGPGLQETTWDGRDGAGQPLAPGPYWLQLAINKQSGDTRRVLILE